MGASPADRQNLAPVDVREHSGWLRLIFDVFQRKHVNTINETRGVEAEAGLTFSRVEQYEQRGGPTATKVFGTRQRGSMSDVPTPQTLIRQVTGIGDPAKGR